MLYFLYRYIVGLCATFVIGITLLLIIFLSDPTGFAAIGKTQTFEPVMTLLYIFSVLLCVISILFTHPFITDGEETVTMETPVAHAAVQGDIVLIIAMSLLQLAAIDARMDFFSKEIVDATAYILKIAVVSILTSSAGFYAIKYRAKRKHRLGEENNAFCVSSSFLGQ